jgi:small subunit ribosomal protein S20
MRNAVKKIRNISDKTEASEMLPKVVALIDKNAKRNLIHSNKASNLKSNIMKHVNTL